MASFLRLCTEARQTVAVVGSDAEARRALVRALVAGIAAPECGVWVAEPGAPPADLRSVVLTLSPPSAGEALLTEDSGRAPTHGDLVAWVQASLVVVERFEPARDLALVRSARQRACALLIGIADDRFEVIPAGGAGPAAEGIDPRLAACVDVVVEVARLSDGSVRVVRIAETGAEGPERFALTPIYEFAVWGLGETGEIAGEHRATRAIPRFVDRRRKAGRRVDLSLYQA
jgi:pilus assembly protein CpaF